MAGSHFQCGVRLKGVAQEAIDAPTVLRAMHENWPKIEFHALREHAGLVLQRPLQG